MSLKTAQPDNAFSAGLIFTAGWFFHNPVKSAKQAVLALKRLAKSANIRHSELTTYYNFLKQKKMLLTGSMVTADYEALSRYIRPSGPARHCLVIQPDFEILAKPDTPPRALLFLMAFAEPRNRDVVMRFAMTAHSLHNAYMQAFTPAAIKKFLKEHSTSPSANAEHLIDDIHKRTGEIRLGYASAYLAADAPLLRAMQKDQAVSRNVVKNISDTALSLKSTADLKDIFKYLTAKGFFPYLDKEKVVLSGDTVQLSLTETEAEYLLTAMSVLKEISFEHDLKTDFAQTDRLLHVLKNALPPKAAARAGDKADICRKELNTAIRDYVVKSLKASLRLPQNLVLNRVAVHYDGANPATVKKDVIAMAGFALKHKLPLVVGYYRNNKKTELFVSPRYLYNDTALYYYNKAVRKEESIALKKIIFTALV